MDECVKKPGMKCIGAEKAALFKARRTKEMMDTMEGWKIAAIAFIGALTGLWGWMGWLVIGWVICMAADYLTGSAAAAKQGEWSSAKAREGIWHKAGMIVVVLVSAGADLLIALVIANIPAVQLPFAYNGLICPVVLVWYGVTELGSITENAVAMGAPVPSWLTRLLRVSRQAIDEAGEKLAGTDTDQDESAEGPFK